MPVELCCNSAAVEPVAGRNEMRLLVWRAGLALALLLGLPAAGWAGALEDARAMVDEGRTILAKAEKARKNKGELYAEGLKKYAQAYIVIKNQELRNDAPDLVAEIGDQIAKANRVPEVVEMREKLITEAIDSADLLVTALRFRHYPEEASRRVQAALARRVPVAGDIIVEADGRLRIER